MGFSCYVRMIPIPLPKASVSMTKGSSKFGMASVSQLLWGHERLLQLWSSIGIYLSWEGLWEVELWCHNFCQTYDTNIWFLENHVVQNINRTRPLQHSFYFSLVHFHTLGCDNVPEYSSSCSPKAHSVSWHKTNFTLRFQMPFQHVKDAWSNWSYGSRYHQKILICEVKDEIWNS